VKGLGEPFLKEHVAVRCKRASRRSTNARSSCSSIPNSEPVGNDIERKDIANYTAA